MMHGMAGSFYLGTSGFAYDEWRHGVFYPEDLKKDDMLDYYSSQLSSVEINYSFRRFPSEKTLTTWRDRARPGFVFTLKANQRITHSRRLKDCDDDVRDFLDLAKEVSIDPSAKQNSGSLGSAVASTYVPEFGAAAIALEPGEISKPVKTQFGWHVIRMVKKDVQSFEDVKPQLLDSSAATVFNDWLVEQASGGAVDVNPKYGRFDEKTLQVMRISSTSTDTATPSAPSGPSA